MPGQKRAIPESQVGASARFSPGDGWFRALSLRERRAAGPLRLDPARRAVAEERLGRWRSEAHLEDERTWEQRLAAEGLDRQSLLALLVEEPGMLRLRCGREPPWLTELSRTWSQYGQPGDGELDTSVEARLAATPLAVALPLLRRFHRDLRQHVEEAAARHRALVGDGSAVMGDLLDMLESRLGGLVARVIPPELAAPVADPEHSWRCLEQYPVLGRMLLVRAQQWLDSSRHFVDRLAADAPELAAAFSGDQPLGAVKEIRALGEVYLGGQSVMDVEFASGTSVVYKPRSIAADAHFYDLLQWLNGHGFSVPFYRPATIERGTHGWVEYIYYRPCAGAEQVRRFFRRQGGHLAALWLVDGCDAHCENVIAQGEYPVIIDLETCFSLPGSGPGQAPGDPFLRESVLKTALLPIRQDGARNKGGLETGGNEQGLNLPTLDDRRVEVDSHRAEVAAGFDEAYTLLLQHRDELMAADGPIRRFGGDRVRYLPLGVVPQVARALISAACHPERFQDALARECVFDRIWADQSGESALLAAASLMKEALERGEIAIFTTSPASRDVCVDGMGRQPDYLVEAGLARVGRRIEQLGDRDRKRQLRLVRASLSKSSWRWWAAMRARRR
jgi:Domain of unknown function (DUF4135)